jgi:hypothetical protein
MHLGNVRIRHLGEKDSRDDMVTQSERHSPDTTGGQDVTNMRFNRG